MPTTNNFKWKPIISGANRGGCAFTWQSDRFELYWLPNSHWLEVVWYCLSLPLWRPLIFISLKIICWTDSVQKHHLNLISPSIASSFTRQHPCQWQIVTRKQVVNLWKTLREDPSVTYFSNKFNSVTTSINVTPFRLRRFLLNSFQLILKRIKNKKTLELERWTHYSVQKLSDSNFGDFKG